MKTKLLLVVALLALPVDPAAAQAVRVFRGATLWDGTGAPARENATLVVRDGLIVSVREIDLPEGAEIVDLSGKWIIPGLINTHGHVNGLWAPEEATEPVSRIVEDLRLYARYGVTGVNSLGGGNEVSVTVRGAPVTDAAPRARLLVAGPVITVQTPEEARLAVDQNADLGVNWIKFRVDDNLGTTSKMEPATAEAIIERAHERGLPVATHLFYLEDAKALLRAGTDLIAHSIRDVPVDDELIEILRGRTVCYVPTLTREVSTFVYAERPTFFDDPFFLRFANRDEMDRVSHPEFQSRMRESPAAARYREALVQAQENLKTLSEAGIPIAFGTDSGPAARFPGYFEHLELELMVEAGLTPEQALWSATGGAAGCLRLSDVGRLVPGFLADFLVLGADPLADIENTKSLETVYIGGSPVR